MHTPTDNVIAASPTRPSLRQRVTGACVAYLIAITTAALIFALGTRESTSEYPFLLLSSIPPALMVLIVSSLVSGGMIIRALLSLVLGIAIAITWTFAAYMFTGGYLMAADFPLFWNWMWGAVIGLLIATLPWKRSSIVPGVLAAGIMLAPAVALFWIETRPRLIVEVLLAPGSPDEEIGRAWNAIQGPPRPEEGRYMADGVGYLARIYAGGSLGVRGGFTPFASDADSAAVDTRLKQSGIKIDVRWSREEQ